MQWEVKGARRDDGADVSMVVRAESQQTAEGIAQLSGVLVESCSLVPSPPLAYAVRRVEPPLSVYRPPSRPWVVLFITSLVCVLLSPFLFLLAIVLPAVDPHLVGLSVLLLPLAGVCLGVGMLIGFVGLLSYAFRA